MGWCWSHNPKVHGALVQISLRAGSNISSPAHQNPQNPPKPSEKQTYHIQWQKTQADKKEVRLEEVVVGVGVDFIINNVDPFYYLTTTHMLPPSSPLALLPKHCPGCTETVLKEAETVLKQD